MPRVARAFERSRPVNLGAVSLSMQARSICLVVLGVAAAAPGAAQRVGATCDYSGMPGVVWFGTDTLLPVSRVAAYLAPILWFSPDEPLLDRAEGPAIRIPVPLPFEAPADSPVVYYQLDEVVRRGSGTGQPFSRDAQGEGVLNVRHTTAFGMSYFTHYNEEVGLGAHPHDVEPVEMRVVVLPSTHPVVRQYVTVQCDQPYSLLVVVRTTAKAHALIWFYSVLVTDEYSEFPIHLLVEEGKHALATDKNGDGVFTPGYDVNRRVNDAWGTRDIIRTGMLFSGGYESWMAKVRRPEHRVFPPLPDDSPLRRGVARRTRGAAVAVYQLRPFPSASLAGDDAHLKHLMEMQGAIDNWPRVSSVAESKQVVRFLEEGTVLRSLSIAYRTDGDRGFSFVFPFFVVKHLEDPMTGGFILQRMYLKDTKLRDFGWMALYTRSASRWLDPYLSAGVEWDTEVDTAGVKDTHADFVFETGLKFRVNVTMSPAKFLGTLTDYWGLRLGISNAGFFDVNRIRYVIEFGAGSF